jgi:HlyD family secretion protein
MNKRFTYHFVCSVFCLLLFLFMNSCRNSGDEADAYGNFEADEIIVSAQSQGSVITFKPDEGDMLKSNELVGIIDTTAATIKLGQLSAQLFVIEARLENIEAQLKVQEEQRMNIAREVDRSEKLLADHAATQQQYDDLSGKLKVLDLQTETIRTQKKVIQGERKVLAEQMAEVYDALKKCRIINPADGIMLEKYIEAGELVTPGKALYKVSDIRKMELRVYISGSQLSSVAIGDSVSVFIDIPDEKTEELPGIVSWISSEVEFTPKIIQTKEERVNMVYAVKVRVNNNGRIKIGMPGEVVFKGSKI